MQFSDEEDIPLKKWVTKRLEDISDADSDVLADYVLALVKSDDPDDQIRVNSIEALEDFLGEHTAPFVDDVLKAVHTKSYLPGFVAPRPAEVITRNFNSQSSLSNGAMSNGSTNGSLTQSRKRTFNERDDDEVTGSASVGDRAYKQTRRGGTRGNRHDSLGTRGFKSSSSSTTGISNQNAFSGIGPIPGMPPGFPSLDPNNPMAAMMAMQAMGFPSLPGFPQFPQPGQTVSPTGFTQYASNGGALPKAGKRCRDYDTMGFCAAGSSCPYEHGSDHLVVPTSGEEYDPKNASLMSGFSSSPIQDNLENAAQPVRGKRGDRGRGRGGRHDRGGRAAFSSAGPNNDRSITSIVVEQIPEEKFTEEAVRQFFSEFGAIEDVTLQAYKRLAIIKYGDWKSAKSAYDSPKVIFDNRFVKVYWYKPNTVLSSAPSSASPNQKDDQEMIDPEEFARKQAEAQKAHEEKLKKMKEAENQKEELETRIKAQAEERKALLEKLARKTGATPRPQFDPEQPDSRPTSSSTVDPSASRVVPAKSLSQTEILRAKLAELEAEAESLGIGPDDINATSTNWTGYPRGGRGRGRPFMRGFGPRGRGAYRGRGAAAGGAVFRLDNRPRTVAVSGPDWNEGTGTEEALREHLIGIGADFEGIVRKPARDVAGKGSGKEILEVAFSQRYIAENFVASAKDGVINGVGKVEFAWVPNKTASFAPVVLNGNDVGDGEGGKPTSKEAGDFSMGHGGNAVSSKAVEVDYDVADDDDDRWMAN